MGKGSGAASTPAATVSCAVIGFQKQRLEGGDNKQEETIFFPSFEAFKLVVKEEPLFHNLFVQGNQVDEARKELEQVLSRIQAGGKVVFGDSASKFDQCSGELLLGGFVDAKVDGSDITCAKPSFEEAVPLGATNASDKKKQVWKLMADDFDDDDHELENEEDLLTEKDIADTTSTAAAECGPGDGTKKKRACKNCSCGLKEMEEAENGDKIMAPTGSSACGNCASGDLNRCATCPYLGLPAFEPGTKPEIKVKADGSKVLVLDGEDDI